MTSAFIAIELLLSWWFKGSQTASVANLVGVSDCELVVSSSTSGKGSVYFKVHFERFALVFIILFSFATLLFFVFDFFF